MVGKYQLATALQVVLLAALCGTALAGIDLDEFISPTLRGAETFSALDDGAVAKWAAQMTKDMHDLADTHDLPSHVVREKDGTVRRVFFTRCVDTEHSTKRFCSRVEQYMSQADRIPRMRMEYVYRSSVKDIKIGELDVDLTKFCPYSAEAYASESHWIKWMMPPGWGTEAQFTVSPKSTDRSIQVSSTARFEPIPTVYMEVYPQINERFPCPDKEPSLADTQSLPVLELVGSAVTTVDSETNLANTATVSGMEGSDSLPYSPKQCIHSDNIFDFAKFTFCGQVVRSSSGSVTTKLSSPSTLSSTALVESSLSPVDIAAICKSGTPRTVSKTHDKFPGWSFEITYRTVEDSHTHPAKYIVADTRAKWTRGFALNFLINSPEFLEGCY